MTQDQPSPKKIPRQLRIVTELNNRLAHIMNAINELKKAPVLSIFLTFSVFILGAFAQQIVGDVYAAIRPDRHQIEVQNISNNLIKKSENIESKIGEIASIINEIISGENQSPGLLQEKVNELLESINSIQPDLSEVALLRRDLFLVAARQKNHDIDVAGMSPNADVTLKMNDGAAICRERYSFGISHAYRHPSTDRPSVFLTSPTGKIRSNVNMNTGNSLVLSDDIGTVVLTYIRHEIIDEEGYYGFNFVCPS